MQNAAGDRELGTRGLGSNATASGGRRAAAAHRCCCAGEALGFDCDISDSKWSSGKCSGAGWVPGRPEAPVAELPVEALACSAAPEPDRFNFMSTSEVRRLESTEPSRPPTPESSESSPLSEAFIV